MNQAQSERQQISNIIQALAINLIFGEKVIRV